MTTASIPVPRDVKMDNLFPQRLKKKTIFWSTHRGQTTLCGWCGDEIYDKEQIAVNSEEFPNGIYCAQCGIDVIHEMRQKSAAKA